MRNPRLLLRKVIDAFPSRLTVIVFGDFIAEVVLVLHFIEKDRMNIVQGE